MRPMDNGKYSSIRFSACFFLSFVLLFFSIQASFSSLYGQTPPVPHTEISSINTQMLKTLYHEAFNTSPQVTMDYIKNEYHVDLDGRDANKEEHVVFLCYECREGIRFVVQVTYFQLVGHNVVVKYADKTKQIRCLVKDGLILVDKTSYSDQEMRRMLKTLIKRVEEENELLRLSQVRK
jgi:hypothetical protein